jgi:transketolase
VDGHDLEALLKVLEDFKKRTDERPAVLIAHTVKGKGVSFVEADYTFHGRALTEEQADRAKEEILCE